jgi:hypothetical protein
MTGRDLEYIENRLMAPASELLEAIERLRQVGEGQMAAELMEGLATLTDLCREQRMQLVVRERGGHTY